MPDTFNKKEQTKKKQQKKKEKEQRKAERQANAKSGFEDMIAYVDEHGNISSTPPDPTRKQVVKEDDIVIGSRNTGGVQRDAVRKGRVTFFNSSKGYGFIKDSQSQESVFVHVNAIASPIKENDHVTFEVEYGPKGASAVSVKKV